MSRSIIGLDFGSCALKAAVWDGGKITRMLEEPMPDQMVRGGSVTSAEAMADFLKRVLKENRISVRRAAVLLPASQVFVQLCELPAMTQNQLKLNLPYEFRDFIPENRDNYFYDYALIEMRKDEAGTPKTMRLLAAAVSKELVQSYANLCRWAGLKLVTAIPVEMAYTNLLRRYNPQTGPQEICIVDCGHTGQRVYFYSRNTFETAREGEQGGAGIDETLADLLGADIHIAHVRKEANAQEELAMPQVRSYLQETLRDAQRAVNFYHFSNPDRQLEMGYYCGGGSRIPFLQEELEGVTELRMRPITELLGETPDPEKAVSCAGAIGAAIQ